MLHDQSLEAGMTSILGIHGIGQAFNGPHTLTTAWFDALRDGLHEVSGLVLKPEDFEVIGYGALFRADGGRGPGDIVHADELDSRELQLLTQWWDGAAALSRESRGLDEEESTTIQDAAMQGRFRAPDVAQQALRQLANSKFFNAIGGPKAVLKLVREAHQFLHDAARKKEILARFEERVTAGTRIVIAHSLGSIVAYEALCRNPQWNVHTLITLGSPLGISSPIFCALTPAPVDGRGAWPGSIKRWVNIADRGDLVALEKKLAPKFGAVDDQIVYNGWASHDATRYLSARATGLALASAWREAGL
jgi:hypothetical protein